jgi:outer membrane protein assembly factor BamD
MLKRLAFILLVVVVLYGCSANKSIAHLPSDVKWQRAESFFQARKFHRAIPYYEQLVFERNSIYTADAQFKLGECHFHRKKFIDAIFEYQELLRLFPDHRLAADTQFRIGQAYVRLSQSPHFDQLETERAIDAFTIFSEKFPADPRISEAYRYIAEMQMVLIEKIYLNGYIYFMMRDYPSAQLYLGEIIALGNRNDFEKMAVYYNALIHIDRRERAEAVVFVKHLEDHFPNSKEHIKATRRLARIDSRLWRMLYFR